MTKIQSPPLRYVLAFLILYVVASLITWALLTDCDPGAVWIGFACVALNGAVGVGVVWAVNQINKP